MASVTGSRLAFFSDVVSADKINVVLTADGSDVAGKAIAGDFNIEVFTATAGPRAAGFDASAFVQDAVQLTNNAVQAGTVFSQQELLDGSDTLIDLSGGSARGVSVQIVGSNGSTDVVIGSAGDTVTGSANPNVSQLIDASGLNRDGDPGPFVGGQTVLGGVGPTTVWSGRGDVITGGAGALQVTDTTAPGSVAFGGGAIVTGGTGNLSVFQFGPNYSITGSTGGTTFIDDTYSVGGAAIGINSSIVGGSGTGLLAGGENTKILAGGSDKITVGSALTYIDASRGNIRIEGGGGAATGTVEGAKGYNTNILAGPDDVITLHAAATYIDALAGDTTVTAGAGFAHIDAGARVSVTGSTSGLEVKASGGRGTVSGASGNLSVFDIGQREVVIGGSGTNFIDDSYGIGGNSTLTGGNGTVTGAGGLAVNTEIIGAPGDSIIGSGGTTYIDAIAGSQAITVGGGATTVQAGNQDTVKAAGGSGALLVYLDSDQATTTIDLGVSRGAATLRDAPAAGAASANVSVTGFSTATDTIASQNSVNLSGQFLGTSTADGKGGTILTFLDGAQMTLAGIADPSKIKFTT